MAYIKLEKWQDAESDSTAALLVDPNNCKALFRRAFARQKMNMFTVAEADLRLLIEKEPNNKQALELLHQVEQALKKSAEQSNAKVSSRVPEVASKKGIITDAPLSKPKVEEIARDHPPLPEAKTSRPVKHTKDGGAVLKKLGKVPKVPSSAPRTALEFEKEWRTLQKYPDQLYAYIKVLAVHV